MVEEKHRDKDVSESERQLIAALPAQGSIGNGALRNKLGWDEKRYWYVRNRLLRAGVLATGRGRGNTFKFVPGIQLELSTFEIKTYDGLDVTAVYEALSHRRAAHYSYVLAYVPDSERAPLKSLLDRLCEDAGDHGVGVILAAQATDYKTWTFAVEPCRNAPEPASLNDFISSQTSEAFQERILTWCRSW